MKKRIVNVHLERAEGPSPRCISVNVPTLDAAEAYLRSWAADAPPPGSGYHKCDFIITWEDGYTYSGTYDLNQDQSADEPTLRLHVLKSLLFFSGKMPEHQLPSNIPANTYLDIISKFPGASSRCAHILDNYHIG